MTTPEDSAAVTPETARVIAGLEHLRKFVIEGWAEDWLEDIDAAIDRLIVLDNARQDVGAHVKYTAPATSHVFAGFTATPVHPRELAMRQDAKRGNFRYQQEEDGA